MVVGITAGLILSQWGLGRFNPDAYAKIFVGAHDARMSFIEQVKKRVDKMKDIEERRVKVEATGSESAMADFNARAERELDEVTTPIDTLKTEMKVLERDHAAMLQNYSSALLLVVVVMMILETLFDESSGGYVGTLRGKFTSIRYAVIAVWLAVFIAQPMLIRDVPLMFFVLLLLVAVGAGLVPLGKRGASDA